MEHADLIVIGAGQSGLATAALAPRHGFTRVLVLEAAEKPGGSWPRYYDSLTLFSPARYSSLPGMPFPGDQDRYPRRDEVVDYLRDYAKRLPADIRTSTSVTSVAQQDGAWSVLASDGRKFTAGAVVAATGDYGTPFTPDLPGRQDFGGQALHAADYRSPDVFAGKRVVVVGGGNSAIQIAADLGVVADTTLASRRPIAWAPQRPLGRDLHWWLKRTRLDVASIRPLLAKVPVSVIDDGSYRTALERYGVDRRDMFSRLTTDGVVWVDGAKEAVDVLVFATGYRLSFPYLTSSGTLDETGAPRHRDGVSTAAPGLGFVGMEFQRSFSSKTLRGVGRDADYLLQRLAPARR
ncbi:MULTISPECIES: flavin-containing monooxygenase [Streptomyces]|uniref:flavin-containing monooxygenase n=1 Tax=Streptomyces TaxID=1883 RepID=UPI001C5FC263|nr:NAD(P)/FAD-dependent oxidoreductase [Streptomyces poriferorum]MBW5249821.1 NAD(P)/FAD-dependent oxidoreductase [Streptomyces poriferorum]MBW5257732.1 NAD(P)/FAD-dependent oxidoreductase [Streptomyces poriferorum]WSV69691.1 NAD(P)/FAD-dependent oxidoreductase [Streptomyces sp. NBC_01012]